MMYTFSYLYFSDDVVMSEAVCFYIIIIFDVLSQVTLTRNTFYINNFILLQIRYRDIGSSMIEINDKYLKCTLGLGLYRVTHIKYSVILQSQLISNSSFTPFLVAKSTNMCFESMYRVTHIEL